MDNKIAVKSGYYFEMFSKDEMPSTLVKSDKKVKLNDIEYDLYEGSSLADEKRIDAVFGDRMGYYIDNYIVEKKKPKCQLIGQDGNIFNLMGIASRTLKRNNMKQEADEMVNRITTSARSYDEALMILDEYVDITGGMEDEEEYEE